MVFLVTMLDPGSQRKQTQMLCCPPNFEECEGCCRKIVQRDVTLSGRSEGGLNQSHSNKAEDGAVRLHVVILPLELLHKL